MSSGGEVKAKRTRSKEETEEPSSKRAKVDVSKESPKTEKHKEDPVDKQDKQREPVEKEEEEKVDYLTEVYRTSYDDHEDKDVPPRVNRLIVAKDSVLLCKMTGLAQDGLGLYSYLLKKNLLPEKDQQFVMDMQQLVNCDPEALRGKLLGSPYSRLEEILDGARETQCGEALYFPDGLAMQMVIPCFDAEPQFLGKESAAKKEWLSIEYPSVVLFGARASSRMFVRVYAEKSFTKEDLDMLHYMQAFGNEVGEEPGEEATRAFQALLRDLTRPFQDLAGRVVTFTAAMRFYTIPSFSFPMID